MTYVLLRRYIDEGEYNLVLTGPFATEDEAITYANALPDDPALNEISVLVMNAPSEVPE